MVETGASAGVVSSAAAADVELTSVMMGDTELEKELLSSTLLCSTLSFARLLG